jgi:hypothetical protein
LGPCEAWSVGKARQKNLGRSDENEDVAKEDKLHIDCSTIKSADTGKKPNKSMWRIMVKAATNFKIIDFYTSKNKMVEPTVEKMHKLKELKILPTIVRIDKGGENKLLKQRAESKDWKFGLKYEYTARNTPQQNSMTKVAFATLTGWATAMMARANVPKAKRHAFFGRAAQTATLLDGACHDQRSDQDTLRARAGQQPPICRTLADMGRGRHSDAQGEDAHERSG